MQPQAELDGEMGKPTMRMQESIKRELKQWLDPANERDRATLAKALIAMYNSDGGDVILGVNDNGTICGIPENHKEVINSDTIQPIIRKYSHGSFIVEIINEKDHIILRVPSGVKTPTVCKNGVEGITRSGAIYIRSAIPGQLSSCEPQSPDDWNRAIECWFDNREADIARFVRRHLNKINSEQTKNELSEWAARYWESKEKNYTTGIKAKGVLIIALALNNEPSPQQIELAAQRTEYSGRIRQPASFIINGNFVHTNNGEEIVNVTDSIEIIRIEKGRALTIRSHEEDVTPLRYPASNLPKDINHWIHIGVTIYVIAEAVRHAIEIGKELKSTEAKLSIKWTGLEGRKLTCEPNLTILGNPTKAQDNEALATVIIKMDSTKNDIPRIVATCTEPLWEKFRLANHINEKMVKQILNEHN